MDGSDSFKERRRWLRLQYLKDIAALQRKHREYMKICDGDIINQSLKQSSISLAIRNTRYEIASGQPLGMKEKARAQAVERIKSIFDPTMSRRISLKVSMGKDVGVYADGITRHVTVGYMWNVKVWGNIYKGTKKRDFGEWIILSADKVKVNSKLVDLYEAKAMHSTTTDFCSGYVAVSKTEKRYAAFGRNAQQAIKKCEAMLSKQIDNILTSQERE